MLHPDLATEERIERFVCGSITKPLSIYSHAVIYHGTVHISAVQGFIPGTFEFPQGGIVAEASQMMRNLSSILEDVDSALSKILKMVFYFKNMEKDFIFVNEVINLYIPDNSPARSSIGVSALPRNARVVVDCLVATNSKNI
ncbi:MAG: RidA family protein [Limnohabitans sp.]|jgi:2-iminobutanoate/2-iminopropanoate deaminase|uniref:RidA family protein n=1 Tax=Limnohabitans sp. TaxID=1907725 RepID=UPI00391B9278